ncbi:hypothetical protein RFI_33865 [Reticulomyxa filosa]|uniref:Uncharacterized protein n=1 Tax=Reticulomyxa filosa TaxID=46433 RepID=X6LQW6_RETFI|nr:hypothetical protein RFI_33865 [Reticulomyxa filosa]|eukprot:ETO03537.1 hypothetical protein RFI_33865 [Reticulomyxa filosa]
MLYIYLHNQNDDINFCICFENISTIKNKVYNIIFCSLIEIDEISQKPISSLKLQYFDCPKKRRIPKLSIIQFVLHFFKNYHKWKKYLILKTRKQVSHIESLTVERSQLDERKQSCNWSLKLRYFKVDLTKKEILKKKDMAPQFRPEVETLQRWLSVCQDRRVLQARGILKLTTITNSENFEQLDEQNEDNIVTKKYHEPASLNIFSDKAVLDQITKGCSITHNRRENNDVNQQSMSGKCKSVQEIILITHTTQNYSWLIKLN